MLNPSKPMTPRPFSPWRGLGLWNLYFLGKVALFWAGVINFHPLENLVFAAALLIPLPPLWLHRVRNLIAVPIAVALFYYDTWLPPFARLLAQPDVLEFSPTYLLELISRFINWELLGAGLVFVVVYSYVAPWLRLTFFSLVALFGLALGPHIHWPSMLRIQSTQDSVVAVAPTDAPTSQAAVPTLTARLSPTTTNLNSSLGDFYSREKQKREPPQPVPADAEDFDILMLSVCSLAWADLEAINLQSHPLLQSMDVVFDQFNSATSYSGPALLRLLRASCGQTPHAELYEPTDKACYLMDNLAEQGFETALALNHNGEFQGFIDEITDKGRYSRPYIPSGKPNLFAFDGSPIWDDKDTLQQVWQQRLQSDAPRQAILYNTISLHDGNRRAGGTNSKQSASYAQLTGELLDELYAFIQELDQSDRKVMVVFIPEHGAGIQGDRMQIPGMREVPSPAITHIPVGVKLVGQGLGKKTTGQPVHVSTPVSHFALAELLNQIVADNVVAQGDINWQELTDELTATLPVSENEGVIVMPFNDTEYVRIGNRDWMPYPK